MCQSVHRGQYQSISPSTEASSNLSVSPQRPVPIAIRFVLLSSSVAVVVGVPQLNTLGCCHPVYTCNRTLTDAFHSLRGLRGG